MKYIVPQDLRISVVSNYKVLVRDLISKHRNLKILPFANGPVKAIDFKDYDDFASGLNRLLPGENLVLIGYGPDNMSLIIYKE